MAEWLNEWLADSLAGWLFGWPLAVSGQRRHICICSARNGFDSVAYKLINIGDTNQNMSQTVATPQKFLEKRFTSWCQRCQHLCLAALPLIYESRQLRQTPSS